MAKNPQVPPWGARAGATRHSAELRGRPSPRLVTFIATSPSRGVTFSSGPGFRYSDPTTSVQQVPFYTYSIAALLLRPRPVSLASLSPVPPGSKGSAIPTFEFFPTHRRRRRAPHHTIVTLTHFRGFRGPRFQSASLTRCDASTRYRLLAEGQQPLHRLHIAVFHHRIYTA